MRLLPEFHVKCILLHSAGMKTYVNENTVNININGIKKEMAGQTMHALRRESLILFYF